MSETTTTSGGPMTRRAAATPSREKPRGVLCPRPRRRSSCPDATPFLCGGAAGFRLRDARGHTDDMTGHDTETDGSTDDAVEQRTFAAFDSGTDDEPADDLAERVERAEADIEALRELLGDAVDTISDLSDNMTGHTDSDEASSDTYEPAPEPADGLRGYE